MLVGAPRPPRARELFLYASRKETQLDEKRSRAPRLAWCEMPSARARHNKERELGQQKERRHSR